MNNAPDPSFNLAFEEELLLSDLISHTPAFCLWRNRGSVIVGVSQVAEDEVNLKYCYDHNIPVVRRHTGGGAVYHDLGNLNFSFFFPSKPAGNPYRHVYTLLFPAFRKLGLEIEMSMTNDLLLDGKKFSGMAQRIIADRVMVHGTILYDTDMETMAQALTTDRSKFNKPRGVASRHAAVTNLKGYLKDTEDMLDLADTLRKTLSGSEESQYISLPDEFLDKVRDRAVKDYKPLNILYTEKS